MKTAPLTEVEKEIWRILADHRLRLKPREREGIRSLSDVYASLVGQAAKSSVYTPAPLVAELFERTPVKTGDRILDCAGGTGNLAAPFVRAGFDVTLMDTDETALTIAALELPQARLCPADFLDSAERFDVIIGNPPYEGHKTMTLEGKAQLREQFGEIMGNKADLHFAFFAKAHEILTPGGILSFLVSRYWLEAESGRALREFILERFTILHLHDWYGERPFGAGVDPLLIVLKKERPQGPYEIPVHRQDAGEFVMPSAVLSADSMKLLTPEEVRLRRILFEETAMSLGEAGDFCQGIITGFDKAFIMTRQEALDRGVEEALLVDWIKSSDLKGRRGDQTLIYADRSAGSCPGFMNYIGQHRERLASRREVRSGRIEFYQLQWGRDRSVFRSRRILFPYKAPASLFVPGEDVYHSADVYSYITGLDETWLCRLLNSPLYDAYIKTELKKLGRDLYEYYPHRLRGIRIPDPARYPDAEDFLRRIEARLQGGDPK